MGEAVGYRILYHEHVLVKGTTKWNIRFPVGKGDVWWNNVFIFDDCDLNGATVQIVIQQHSVNPDHYRAVSVSGDDRYREAWGNNLHALLKKLGIFPGPYRAILQKE
jgi:hypothetical protein